MNFIDIKPSIFNIDDIEYNIINIKTNFGEYIEKVIKAKYHLLSSNDNSYDLLDYHNKRIEVKASRITKQLEYKTLFDKMICNKRLLHIDELTKVKSNICNIQQIKPYCFDLLYFCYMIYDGLLVFKINSNDITKMHGYCNKQHRGNKNEGQFHTNSIKIKKIEKYLYDFINMKDIIYIWKTTI